MNETQGIESKNKEGLGGGILSSLNTGAKKKLEVEGCERKLRDPVRDSRPNKHCFLLSEDGVGGSNITLEGVREKPAKGGKN